MADQLVSRECPICRQHDDHPRHVFALPTGEESARHMDCCAAVGCDLCALQIKDAAGVKGAELRAHLVAKSEG